LHACGFIPKEKRDKRVFDFPDSKDPNLTTDICKVWWAIEYNYMYREYNLLKKATNIHEFSYYDRFIFRTFDNYLATKEAVARKTAMDKAKQKP